MLTFLVFVKRELLPLTVGVLLHGLCRLVGFLNALV